MKLLLIFSLLISSAVFAKSYKLGKDSEIGFSVYKYKISESVAGKFNEFSGTFDYDEKKDEISNIKVVIKAASINTENEKRDGHLKADDFFGVEKHPEITFTAAGPFKAKKRFTVKGKLNMKGKELEEEITIKKFTSKKGAVSFEVQGEIDRYQYGVSWNARMDQKKESFIDRVKNAAKGLVGKYVIGNKVDLKIKVQAM